MTEYVFLHPTQIDAIAHAVVKLLRQTKPPLGRIDTDGKFSWVPEPGLNENGTAKMPDFPVRKSRADLRILPRTQQAGILCADPKFQAHLGATGENDAAWHVRKRLNIASRADIDKNTHTAAEWDKIVAGFLG